MFRNDGGKRFQEVTTVGRTSGTSRRATASPSPTSTTTATRTSSRRWAAPTRPIRPGACCSRTRTRRRRRRARNPDWIDLELEGTTANRAALGARVTVRLQTPSGPRRLHRLVSTGGSFGSSPFRLFVGLGDATAITGVDVSWPAASAPPASCCRHRRPSRASRPAQWSRLKQGAPAPVELKRPAFTLSHAAAAPHVHH